MYQRNNEGMVMDEIDTCITPNHNNSLKTLPNAIQKHLANLQTCFTCKYPVKSLNDRCELDSKRVKKTTEFTEK